MFLKTHCQTLDLPCHSCLSDTCMALAVCICACHQRCRCRICQFRLLRNQRYGASTVSGDLKSTDTLSLNSQPDDSSTSPTWLRRVKYGATTVVSALGMARPKRTPRSATVSVGSLSDDTLSVASEPAMSLGSTLFNQPRRQH